jgi:septal ring-binding cell division protein DamX
MMEEAVARKRWQPRSERIVISISRASVRWGIAAAMLTGALLLGLGFLLGRSTASGPGTGLTPGAEIAEAEAATPRAPLKPAPDPEPAQTEPSKPEPPKPEPTPTEPTKPEPLTPEPAEPEPEKSEAEKPEPEKAEPAKPDAKPSETAPAKRSGPGSGSRRRPEIRIGAYTGDGFGIQLGAYPSLADAESYIADHAGALGGTKIHVIPIPIPGRGIWHRVRVGHYGSKTEAENARRRLPPDVRGSAIVVSYR